MINKKDIMDLKDYIYYMNIALDEARKAYCEDEVPIGAVLVDWEGNILSRAHNRVIQLRDPTSHAEIVAIREAALRVGNYRLNNTILFVTVEPCPMCMGALIHARVQRLVFGTEDKRWGGASSLYRIGSDKRLNHQIDIVSGIMEEECRDLIKRFFSEKRTSPWVERYRSGRNGGDSKSLCPVRAGHVGSNPTLSAI